MEAIVRASKTEGGKITVDGGLVGRVVVWATRELLGQRAVGSAQAALEMAMGVSLQVACEIIPLDGAVVDKVAQKNRLRFAKKELASWGSTHGIVEKRQSTRKKPKEIRRDEGTDHPRARVGPAKQYLSEDQRRGRMEEQMRKNGWTGARGESRRWVPAVPRKSIRRNTQGRWQVQHVLSNAEDRQAARIGWGQYETQQEAIQAMEHMNEVARQVLDKMADDGRNKGWAE